MKYTVFLLTALAVILAANSASAETYLHFSRGKAVTGLVCQLHAQNGQERPAQIPPSVFNQATAETNEPEFARIIEEIDGAKTAGAYPAGQDRKLCHPGAALIDMAPGCCFRDCGPSPENRTLFFPGGLEIAVNTDLDSAKLAVFALGHMDSSALLSRTDRPDVQPPSVQTFTVS